MCFCQMQGNTLIFTLKKGWRGKVTVECTGQQKKRVQVDWGIPGAPVELLDTCDLGPHIEVERVNDTELPLQVVLNLFYADALCSSGVPITTPLANGTQTLCNETPHTQNASFHYEAPQPGETLQVTIENDDDQQGEEGG